MDREPAQLCCSMSFRMARADSAMAVDALFLLAGRVMAQVALALF
jgi:hypothetical protein